MILSKITTGYVIQEFDTDTGKFIYQKFVASDEVDYEIEGDAINHSDWVDKTDNAYLPFDMNQP